MSDAEYEHMLAKARDAARGGWGVQSTGEQLSSALILNRPDWLAKIQYTSLEAMERVESGGWSLAMLRRAQKQLVDEGIRLRYDPWAPRE